jgi:hypothetical protein
METLRECQEIPDVPTPQRATMELAKRIRKLRWIGLEKEADRLQTALSGVTSGRCVFAEPREPN